MWGYSIFNPWPFLIVAAGRSMELYQLHWPQPQCLHRKEHLLSWGTEQRGIIAYGLWMCGPVHTVYAGVWKSSTHQDNETTLQHGIAKVKPRRHIIIYHRIYLWHDCSHANWDETCLLPIGSMYGIYTNIGGILMVNVTIYGIHGSYGLLLLSCRFSKHILASEPCVECVCVSPLGQWQWRCTSDWRCPLRGPYTAVQMLNMKTVMSRLL